MFYVSANGSNESGDGSQEHPFRTIEHIKSIVMPYKTTISAIYIHPLTDIIETQVTGFLGVNRVYINQKGEHTVTFNKTISLRNGIYTFTNCVFKQAVDLVEKGYAVFNQCKYYPVAKIPPLRCRYQSFAVLYSGEFNMDKNIVDQGIACYDHSFIHLADNLVFKGECTYLMEAFMKGAIYFTHKSKVDTSQATGAKFFIHEHSSLILVQRGDAIFGNLTAGTVDESSKVF